MSDIQRMDEKWETRAEPTDAECEAMESSLAAPAGSARIDQWHKSNCNGDWEHSYGVTIETLDNPGWWVKIDLAETPQENLTAKGKDGTLEWETDKFQLLGYCEPLELEALLTKLADVLVQNDRGEQPRTKDKQ